MTSPSGVCGTAQSRTAGRSAFSPEELQLWKNYARLRNDASLNAICEFYIPLLKSIAVAMHSRLPLVDVSFLVSEGFFGLRGAAQRFSYKRNLRFATFATPRIRGAMLDGVRCNDHLSRSVRAHAAKIEEARERLYNRGVTSPTSHQLSFQLHVKKKTVEGWINDAEIASQKGVSLFLVINKGGDRPEKPTVLATVIEDTSGVEPDCRAENYAWWGHVLRGLSMVEKASIILYFRYGWTMKRIGAHLLLSESRVSQMHSEIIARIAKLRTVEDFADISTGGNSIRCLRWILPFLSRRRRAIRSKDASGNQAKARKA